MGREEKENRKLAKLEKQRKRARHAGEPNTARIPKEIAATDDSSAEVLWSFRYFDNHDWRTEYSSEHCSFSEIAEKLRAYSSRTWGEILADKTRDHACAINTLVKTAKDRLVDLQFDDLDELILARLK